MLQEAVESGTGAAARLPVPVAGKTGSTNDNRDAWFVGYTPRHLAAVFIGHDDNRPLPGGGGALAAPLWRRVMAALADEDLPSRFPVPRGVVGDVFIDPYTGLRAGPGCPERLRTAFVGGTEPRDWAPCSFAGVQETDGEREEGGAESGQDGGADSGAAGDPAANPSGSGPALPAPPEKPAPEEPGRWLLFRRLLGDAGGQGEDDNTLGTSPEGASSESALRTR